MDAPRNITPREAILRALSMAIRPVPLVQVVKTAQAIARYGRAKIHAEIRQMEREQLLRIEYRSNDLFEVVALTTAGRAHAAGVTGGNATSRPRMNTNEGNEATMGMTTRSIREQVLDLPGAPVLHQLSNGEEAITDIDLSRLLGLTLPQMREELRTLQADLDEEAPELAFYVGSVPTTGRDFVGAKAIVIAFACLSTPGALPPATVAAATACMRTWFAPSTLDEAGAA